MDNKIIQGYLKDFSQDFGFNSSIQETKLFEHFGNFCILSKIHPEAFYNDNFKIQDLNIGKSNDTGLDGVAIVVNDHIVWSVDEIEDLIKSNNQKLEVRFIFIQSKTSSSFDSSQIGNFIFGVKDFFKDEGTLVTNKDLEDLRALKNYLYDKSVLMDNRPTCELYYITTGVWHNDRNVTSRIDSDLNDLKVKHIFSKVELVPVDSIKLESYYKEIRNKVTKEIEFDKHTSLPKIEGVIESFIGIISANEFFKLIVDSEGKIQKNLFYDNVRDYQGLNPVNAEIQKTILDSKKQLQFPILNNGITVVAKGLNKVGTSFKVKDFQIVNGCQTSHVLFANRDKMDLTNIFIPIKLISTDNQEVINYIIKATNRQTEVKLEAFESLKDFHKRLQEFYNSNYEKSNIKYERRTREYENILPSIPRSQIITLATQLNSFISMFLNEPHSTHRYYGELLNAYANKIFLTNHNLEMYYVSSLALNKVDKLLKAGDLSYKYRRYKYHLLTVFRILVAGFKYPNLTSREMKSYAEKIERILLDENECLDYFRRSCKCVDKTLRNHENKGGVESSRLKQFTHDLIEEAKKHSKGK